MSAAEGMKQMAAQYAAAHLSELVGKKATPFALGLGSGSTMRYFVDALAQDWAGRLHEFICVPSSQAIAAQAEARGIALGQLGDIERLDVTIDGADEIDPQLNLIKGGGGALLREKIIAAASQCFVVIADASKCVTSLGAFALPIEVDCFAHLATRARIIEALAAVGLSGAPQLRMAGDAPFTSDGGHYVYDLPPLDISAPHDLALRLSAIPGVVEHGLFLGMTERAFIASTDGIKIMER